MGTPPPEYSSPYHLQSPNVADKSHLLPESLGVLALTKSSGIHWLLLPHDPRTSKRLLRFDIILPVDQICYQYSSNVRERLLDEDLDEPASDEPMTKMRIIFEQRPFNWTIEVDNPKRIRCRDVFEAIHNSFNQQLALGEMWRVPNREACEDAFRLRNLVLGSSLTEQSLGWKRVDVLLHHTFFHGLTMNPEGDWILNLGAPLPVVNLPHSLPFSRRDSSSTGEDIECSGLPAPYEVTASPMQDSASKPDSSSDALGLSLTPGSSRCGPHPTEGGSTKSPAAHSSLSITVPVEPPRQQFVRSRPINRPLGPRSRPRQNRLQELA
ncbi:hypothetical protein HD554DRAFT_1547555 [Boletus coccyginus]|nr:hypothetical protein HD554DRAFT_1547555 [Boletus coccyginus]